MSIFRSFFGAKERNSDQFELLDIQAYKKAVINKEVQLVDVRTPSEFKKGHLGRAINIDFYDKNSFCESFEQLNKEEPVYLYCRSGVRSKKAAYKLLKMGFSKVYNLKGGINSWL